MSPAWVRVVGSSLVVDGPVDDGSLDDGSLDDEVSDPDVVVLGDGPMISEVITGPVVVMVAVVVVVEPVGGDDANVGSTNWVGASCVSAPLVRLTTAHTSRAMTPRATTLAPATTGVE